jgi:hypothetical protein
VSAPDDLELVLSAREQAVRKGIDMIHDTGNLRDFQQVVNRTYLDLVPHMDEFDSIATSGISGLVIAAPVAFQLQKPLVIVREGNSMSGKCVHAKRVEGFDQIGEKYIFLDDHIHLGRVFQKARFYINEEALRSRNSFPYCVATYEYEERKWLPYAGQESRRKRSMDRERRAMDAVTSLYRDFSI